MDKNFGLDLSHFSSELRLLLEIMKMEAGDIELLLQNNRGSGDIDWDLFIQLAKHHRVYPTLYKKLKGIDETCIPPRVVKALNKLYQKNTFQMLHLSGETERLAKILAEHQIKTLFLKGPVLAADLYGDISFRTSSDLDILIPIHDLDRVEEILLKLDYVKDDYILTILNDWKWRHHHITFFNPHKGIKVEIHWRLNPGPSKEPSFQELWERRRKSSLTAYPVYLLGREDLFLFLVTHGARHGWSRLRWLVDIDRMIKQNLNGDHIIGLLRKYQSLHLGGQALILASQLLKTEIVEEMWKLIEGERAKRVAEEALFYIQQMVNLHNDPLPEEVASYHKRHLFSLMSHQQKLLFIMSFLYPYSVDAETLPLPKSLHFLYFPLRPILCAWRKTRKQALP